MYHERLITGVAATLGAIAVLLTVVAVTGSPLAFPVAVAFAASALLMYDQLSGRMAARVYRRVERHARVEGSGDAGRSQGGPFNGRAGGDRRRADRGNRGRNHQRTADQQRGGFGAGPREEWRPPRDGATMGEAATGARRGGARERNRASGDRRRSAGPVTDDGPTAAAAYRTLDLEPGADEETVTQAYREKVKEVHPDTSGGDEEAFMEVKAAYERLTD